MTRKRAGSGFALHLDAGKIKISAGFILFAALMFYIDETGSVILMLLASAVHELGHYICLRMCGGRVEEFKMGFLGAVIKCDTRYPISYAGEIATALCGPAANIIAAVTASLLYGLFGDGVFFFAGLNVVIAAFNLCPAMPLDGGRALLYILCALSDPVCASKICLMVSRIIAVLAVIAGAALFIFTGFNFTLLACGCLMAGFSFWDKGADYPHSNLVYG